ncbi:MAG: acetyl-CoA C-acyltransferase, partial [Halobacteriaceae archaeon]
MEDPDRIPVITAAKRTPQGKDNGAFSDVRSEDLSTAVIEELLKETGVEPGHVQDLMWGVAQQRSEQDANVARVIALLSPLGEETPATTINRWCASSMQAIMSAADAIRAGQRTCIIAGGVENMSRVPMDSMPYGELHPDLAERYDIPSLEMGMTAEKVSEKYDISRNAQDQYALRSHQRAAEATNSGRFDAEIVPIETGSEVIKEDEGIRRDTSLEKLESLPPVFKGDGTVTAGNSSQISDGAAGLLVTSETFAR